MKGIFKPGKTYTEKQFNELRRQAQVAEEDMPAPQGPISLATDFVFRLPPRKAGWNLDDILGSKSVPFPLLGGYRRSVVGVKQDFTDDFIVANPALGSMDPDDSLPEGTEVRARWPHLRTCRTGGRAFYGNWVGNGATFWWFSRPTNLMDLAGKFHDFAYEANAVTWEPFGQKMPEAFWSRKAKADFLFVSMTKVLVKELDPEGKLWQKLSDLNFDDDPELFRKGDGFVNPLVHLPGNWLTLPYSCLEDKPKPCLLKTMKVQPGGKVSLPFYEKFFPSEVVVPDEDREGAWRPLVSQALGSDASLVELENLDENDGQDFVRADPWRAMIKRT